MSRPRLEITEDLCNKAEALAAQGLSRTQIALCLGIGERTLYEKQAQYPQFAQAIKAGVAKGIAQVTNYLMENAKSGNATAQIFYLKNRAPEKWRDMKAVEHSGEIISRVKTLTDEDLVNEINRLITPEQERTTITH